MASRLPAEILHFAVRATQLEKANPQLMCSAGEHYIANWIIGKGLHIIDKNCMGYIATLIDKLEQIKTKIQRSDNNAIPDDVALRALGTFLRADIIIRTNKVPA
ncbi:uncharacterized protein K452DRAFT_294316 [Aplosporella prunicola CBS 121167]|uniref:Vta1/callose synthase N-terminal domain-containing protein n=1 Tax=Aplosporella prunicola CBS 121167 TaxID=1176127 RepID=A0A6A6BRQ8_9PEZI|nr:uncharacterized protein K452DRAFT_294316 [Aplosporella prunicola CBS 121167]KAF2146776.1 hypothetical protein K452DRAFT_294316 [Aplosporella prunicola CBS 121167]